MELLFENENGSRLIMSQKNKDVRLTDWDFTNTTEETNVAQIPFYHGTLYENCRLGARDLYFTGYTYGKNKQEIVRALSPLAPTRLIINGNTYAYGKVIDTPTFSKYKCGFFTFTYRMFSPFFYSAAHTLTVEEPGAGRIYNDGDINTPTKIVLYGKDTLVTSKPYIKNETTEEIIAFDYVLGKGARIEIDTSIEQKTINIVKSDETIDGFSYMTFESTMFELAPGYNSLSSNCRFSVEFSNRYLELIL